MSFQGSHLRNLSSFLLPWSRPPIKEWEQARNIGFTGHQQLTRTCHEYRDTDYWMRAFMLKWENEAAESGQSLSITVRIRWIAAAGESPEQNEPLQLQPSRKFALFFLARPCSSFCSTRTQSIEGMAARTQTNTQAHTIQVTDSAQASEILRERARARSQPAHMASQQATPIAFEGIAEAINQWMTPKTSIHWIVPSNPEQPRIRFRVRPQFADFLALSLTCKGTYRISFWRKAGFKR